MAHDPPNDQRQVDRYKKLHGKQMRDLSRHWPQFLAAIRRARSAGCEPGLLRDAEELLAAFSGNLGDGALEIYRDLDRDVRQAREFVARWQESTHPEAQQLVSAVTKIRDALVEMMALVQSTPPELMEALKADVRQVRSPTVPERDMNWDKKIINPASKSQRGIPSPAVMHFFGAVSFVVCGLVTFLLGRYLTGVNGDLIFTIPADPKVVGISVVSFFVGLIGSFIGTAIGASIKVRSDPLNYIYSILFQNFITGFVIWSVLSGFFMTRVYSQAAITHIFHSPERWAFILDPAAAGAASGLLIGIFFMITHLFKEPLSRFGTCILLSLFSSIPIALLEATRLGIDQKSLVYWIVKGAIVAVMTPFMASVMIQRDDQARKRLKNLTE